MAAPATAATAAAPAAAPAAAAVRTVRDVINDSDPEFAALVRAVCVFQIDMPVAAAVRQLRGAVLEYGTPKSAEAKCKAFGVSYDDFLKRLERS